MPKNPNKTYRCVISGLVIPTARVKALILLGVPESRWTRVEFSQEKKKQGIYMGESGTSELKVVDKVYDDSVHSVFKRAEKEVVDEE